jgi:hypothetical protein
LRGDAAAAAADPDAAPCAGYNKKYTPKTKKISKFSVILNLSTHA